MIIELICAPLFILLRGLLSVIPVLSYIPASVADTITLLVKAMQFFPFDVWFLCVGSFIFWISLHLSFSFLVFVINLILGKRV